MSYYARGNRLIKRKKHNVVMTYEYYQTEKVNWHVEKELWEGLKSIELVNKTIEILKFVC